MTSRACRCPFYSLTRRVLTKLIVGKDIALQVLQVNVDRFNCLLGSTLKFSWVNFNRLIFYGQAALPSN